MESTKKHYREAIKITGFLNNTTSANLKSYEAKAFSDANSGSLRLEVNGSVIHEVEITGSFDLIFVKYL